MARGQWILLSVQWILFLTCPTDKWTILRNSPYRSTVKSILLIQIFWRVVEMTFGLVNARFCKNDFLCSLLLVFTNFLKTICFFFCVWESLFNFIHISSRKQLGSTKHQKDCSNNEYKSGKGIYKYKPFWFWHFQLVENILLYTRCGGSSERHKRDFRVLSP